MNSSIFWKSKAGLSELAASLFWRVGPNWTTACNQNWINIRNRLELVFMHSCIAHLIGNIFLRDSRDSRDSQNFVSSTNNAIRLCKLVWLDLSMMWVTPCRSSKTKARTRECHNRRERENTLVPRGPKVLALLQPRFFSSGPRSWARSITPVVVWKHNLMGEKSSTSARNPRSSQTGPRAHGNYSSDVLYKIRSDFFWPRWG